MPTVHQEKFVTLPVNNFPDYLPLPQAQLAEELTKESYDFGFIALPPQKN